MELAQAWALLFGVLWGLKILLEVKFLRLLGFRTGADWIFCLGGDGLRIQCWCIASFSYLEVDLVSRCMMAIAGVHFLPTGGESGGGWEREVMEVKMGAAMFHRIFRLVRHE